MSGCGWAVGLNDNNAILNSVDVVVEVGVQFQYLSGCGWAVGSNENNAILNSVEVGVELGNIFMPDKSYSNVSLDLIDH